MGGALPLCDIAPSTSHGAPLRPALRASSRSPRPNPFLLGIPRISVALGPDSARAGALPNPASSVWPDGLRQSENHRPAPQSLQFARRAKPAGPPGPLVRVRLSVRFRCHAHQMLCIGGSQFPFGWSFVSIAKVPMTWNPKDVWVAEVELPAGMRLEYKYVILEEQVWTKQEDEDAEGVMEWTYRTGTEPGQPLDVQTIRKQMAIVDWQPGPNRVIDVPTVEELANLEPGDSVPRTPAQPCPLISSYGRRTRSVLGLFPPEKLWESGQPIKQPCEPNQVVWEELLLDEDGSPLLKRNDVWPYYFQTPQAFCDDYPE